MDNHKPKTSEGPQIYGRGEVYDARLVPEDKLVARGSDYDTAVPERATALDHDLSRRVKTAAATEIGDPHGRIPSAEQTREQLAAAKNSQLPVDASRSAQNHLDTGSSAPSKAREHRKSNYAPGYEKAFDVVPQTSYDAGGHDPAILPHENLGSKTCG